jgi:oxygen-independent coproporphyrinogen-3 oxidase
MGDISEPMHLYLHVPFCARRCSYCDFAIAVRRTVPSRRYAEAVLRDWERWQRHPVWDQGTTVETVYLGGGTPSRLEPAAIAQLLDRIRADRTVAPGAEVTLEANPDDVTDAAGAAWRSAGVTRVSLGVQSFEPAVLSWMHRTHTADQVPAAVRTLRRAGFEDLSVDLIFALPGALGRRLEADLDRALALEPQHLSLYGLTIEEGTPLARWTVRGDSVPADEDRYAREFLAAHAALERAGYEHYEVSNAALPGHRARHNSAYWRRAPYIGLGPSAHSGFGSVRQWNIREWAAYADAAESGAELIAGREELDAEAVRLEELYLGLRTLEGVPADRIPPEDRAAWIAQGWACLEAEQLRLTPEGWLRLDALAAGTDASSAGA